MYLDHEVALLVAVALPGLAIVAINVALLAAGERDTLLLPGFHRFPTAAALAASAPESDAGAGAEPEALAQPETVAMPAAPIPARLPSREERVREAA